MESITSRQNPRIHDILQLRKPEHRRQRGQFLIEGLRESVRAAESRLEIFEIFVTTKAMQTLPPVLREKRITIVSNAVFSKVSLRENHDGVLALAAIPRYDFPDSLPADALLVVAECMEKPGNLGAILRTMDATGCSLLLLVDPLTDPWNPNVVRASQGALFAVPIVCCSNEQALQFLRKQCITVVATTPQASEIYWNSFAQEATAIVVGNENTGLSRFWLDAADRRVAIPMVGTASDSLNANVATGLCLYEALRMRLPRNG